MYASVCILSVSNRIKDIPRFLYFLQDYSIFVGTFTTKYTNTVIERALGTEELHFLHLPRFVQPCLHPHQELHASLWCFWLLASFCLKRQWEFAPWNFVMIGCSVACGCKVRCGIDSCDDIYYRCSPLLVWWDLLWQSGVSADGISFPLTFSLLFSACWMPDLTAVRQLVRSDEICSRFAGIRP